MQSNSLARSHALVKGTPFVAATLLALSPALAQADEHSGFANAPYGYFGLGLDTLSYEEKLDNLLGVSVKTDFSVTVPLQRSGGYTSINDQWGFAITSLSTLFDKDENESWNASGYGAIQRNQMALSRQETSIMGYYHWQNGYHLMGGVHYSNISFNRHHFVSAGGTDAFRNERLGPGQVFEPEAIDGSVSEEIVTLYLRAGLGYDSYFMDPHEGLRFMYEASLGLPLYRRINNAYENAVITDFIGEGFNVNAAVGLGWQFSKHVSLLYRAEAMYTYLGDLKQGRVIMPEVTMFGIANSLTLYWNFGS